MCGDHHSFGALGDGHVSQRICSVASQYLSVASSDVSGHLTVVIKSILLASEAIRKIYVHNNQLGFVVSGENSCTLDHRRSARRPRNSRDHLRSIGACTKETGERLVHGPVDPCVSKRAESGKVRRAEIVGERTSDSVRRENLPRSDPASQRLGRKIDEHDVARTHEVVGYTVERTSTRNPRRDVTHRYQVRNVHGRQDVETGCQELTNIVVSLPAIRTGVGELIDHHDVRLEFEHRSQVEFLEHRTSVPHGARGHDSERHRLIAGGRPVVAFQPADHHLFADSCPPPGLSEHPVCLADAGCCPEKRQQSAWAKTAVTARIIHDRVHARAIHSEALTS